MCVGQKRTQTCTETYARSDTHRHVHTYTHTDVDKCLQTNTHSIPSGFGFCDRVDVLLGLASQNYSVGLIYPPSFGSPPPSLYLSLYLSLSPSVSFTLSVFNHLYMAASHKISYIQMLPTHNKHSVYFPITMDHINPNMR